MHLMHLSIILLFYFSLHWKKLSLDTFITFAEIQTFSEFLDISENV